MEMTTKMKLITVYIVIGMVWCILNLPNLLAKAGNNTWKAIGIALIRIAAWPALVGMTIQKFLKTQKESKDGQTDSND
jgi:hypothetical protein